jgi:hypothetical protein
VTETERRRGTGTRSATVIATTATATEKGKGTGTEIMTVTVTGTGIATAAVNGENVTAIVRRRETVVRGTTGTMTTRDGHRVSTDGIVNGTGRMTRRGTVVTETEIGMLHEDQVREKRTGSGVQEEMGRKTEKATMSLERSERQRAMSEARKCVAFSCLSLSLSFFITPVHRGQGTILKPLQPRTEKVGLKHQRREKYDSFILPNLLLCLQMLPILSTDTDRTYPKAGIRLLVGDGSLVPLSSLLLEDVLHLPFCVLDDRSLHGDVAGRDDWGATESVLARANLVYLGQR